MPCSDHMPVIITQLAPTWREATTVLVIVATLVTDSHALILTNVLTRRTTVTSTLTVATPTAVTSAHASMVTPEMARLVLTTTNALT